MAAPQRSRWRYALLFSFAVTLALVATVLLCLSMELAGVVAQRTRAGADCREPATRHCPNLIRRTVVCTLPNGIHGVSRVPAMPPGSAFTSTRMYASNTEAKRQFAESAIDSGEDNDSEAEISHSPARQSLNLLIKMMDQPTQPLVPFVIFSGSKEWMLCSTVEVRMNGKLESPGALDSRVMHRRLFTRVELDSNDMRVRRARVQLRFAGQAIPEDGDRTLDEVGIRNGSVVECHVLA